MSKNSISSTKHHFATMHRAVWLTVFLLCLVSSGCGPVDRWSENSAQTSPIERTELVQLDSGFVHHTIRDVDGHEAKYRVFLPEAYVETHEWPTILFLHGAGQTGSDGELSTRGGLADAISLRRGQFPFIVIFPQSEHGTWEANSPDGQRALTILGQVQQNYRVDSKRIYLTGYSMGGEGTWSLAASQPHLFAAIVPITPGKNLAVAKDLANIPIWCFQGAKDDPMRVQNTRSMMLELQRPGARVVYHEYPDLEHDSWTATYQSDEIFEWMLQQVKP